MCTLRVRLVFSYGDREKSNIYYCHIWLHGLHYSVDISNNLIKWRKLYDDKCFNIKFTASYKKLCHILNKLEIIIIKNNFDSLLFGENLFMEEEKEN